jgi:hypothetical protein
MNIAFIGSGVGIGVGVGIGNGGGTVSVFCGMNCLHIKLYIK